ncbi:class I SAM-dependent methyltransferase [Erythrobacter sp. SDW2]|uniref:methyltransferase domain-containing protein n=1 Tax=Erythrobacter sp. SDW2 TaxID=2907154 RepID=UPI001F367771|nr:methyltransferase domain-containing protein [Erythrobacter sp. SDW2]UIP05820.1 class I SAM-dependent methyltransferase [Erythrobacter sp. SDW2]
MTEPRVPKIFSRQRAMAKWNRAQSRRNRPDAAQYIVDTIAEDIIERLEFMRAQPNNALVIGDTTGKLGSWLAQQGVVGKAAALGSFDEAQPWPNSGFDLIVHLMGLGHVNDLPGALLHARGALAEGGILMAAFPGAGSLTVLRQIMLAADGERPAARMHPLVDNQAGAGLLQRAGFKRQVVDSYPLRVRFGSLDRMVSDLRDHGLTSALATGPWPVTKAGYRRALAAFDGLRDGDGKVSETVEILTLTAWR